MIGLRFSGGPLGFPGFCIGCRIPLTRASGVSPVAAVLLKMSAISSKVETGAYLMNSALSWSGPAALLLLSRLARPSI